MGTDHKLITKVLQPETANARRNPSTPSPILTSPNPLSQAINIVNSFAHKSNTATSWANKNPFPASGGKSPPIFQVFAPAKAKPERMRELSIVGVEKRSLPPQTPPW